MDSNLENINNFNESWCRTCNERTSVSFLHSLEERTLNCPSLADMLLEIAKINIKMEDECDLPKHVCGNCMYKLKNAYAYVMQAQQVNKQFLAKLGTVVQKQHVKQVDCLLEAPIDMDSVKIKTENIDESEGYDAFKGIGSDNETKEKDNSKNLCSIEVENLFNDENDMKEEVISTTGQSETAIVDPITIAATHWESDSNDSYDPKKDEASDSSDNILKYAYVKEKMEIEEFVQNNNKDAIISPIIKDESVREQRNMVQPLRRRGQYSNISNDTKKLLISYYENGITIREAAQKTKININTAKSIIRGYKKDGEILHGRRGGYKQKKLTTDVLSAIVRYKEDNPLITIKGIKQKLKQDTNIDVSETTIRNGLKEI